jgi:hypothetical protein
MSTEKIHAEGSSDMGVELTPAASEVLDLSADGFRRQILNELSRAHGRSGYPIRAADVRAAIDEVSSTEYRRSKLSSRLVIVALLLATLALGVQFAVLGSGASQLAWASALGASLAGASTGIAAVYASRELRRRHSNTLLSEMFLQQFSALEGAARQVATQAFDLAENASLGRVIQILELLDIWTSEDSQAFRRLLSSRNSLVHEYVRSLSADDMRYGLTQVTRLSHLVDVWMGQFNKTSEAAHIWRARTRRRSGLAYEERIANALRQASLEVTSTSIDRGYDLFVDTPAGGLALIVKHRDWGVLDVSTLRSMLINIHLLPLIPVAVVTNVGISKAAFDYVQSTILRDRPIAIVLWRDDDPEIKLVQQVEQAATVPSASS